MSAFTLLLNRLVLAVFLTYVIGNFLPFDIPSFVVFIVSISYTFQVVCDGAKPAACDHFLSQQKQQLEQQLEQKQQQERHTQQVAQAAKDIKTLEWYLAGFGLIIEESGEADRKNFQHFHQAQKDQKKLFIDYQHQIENKFGSVTNMLEVQAKEITDVGNTSLERNSAVYNILESYGQLISVNQKLIQGHKDSFNETLKTHGEAIEKNRELAQGQEASTKKTLDSHKELIEENKKLTQTSIDKLTAGHASLVKDRRSDIDGFTMLIDATHQFAAAHKKDVSETLGKQTQQIAANQKLCEDTQKLFEDTQTLCREHEKVIKELDLGIASRRMVVNVQKFAHGFRDRHEERFEAIDKKLKGMDQKASLLRGEHNSLKVEWPGKERVDGLTQRLDTELGQLKNTVNDECASVKKDALAAEARHAEEMQKMRQELDEMKKLREEVQEMQTLREEVRQLRGAMIEQPMDADTMTTTAITDFADASTHQGDSSVA